jgi:hypothetical protein
VKDWGSSGYRGDVFNVVQDVHGLTFPEALEWIVDELNLNVGGDSAPSETPPSPPGSTLSRAEDPEPVVSHEQVERWHERLVGESNAAQAARSYLTDERGIAEGVLRAARIGLAHSPSDDRATWWIMIPVPHRAGGDPPPIVAVKGFAFDPEAGGWKRNDDDRKIPRNAGSAALYDLVPSDPFDRPVLVCEGELDALCALSNGFNAVTGTAGAGTFKPEWARYVASLAPAQEHGVDVAFDGDETGREGAQKAAPMLHEAGLDVRVASLPDGMDVNDVLVGGDAADLHAHLAQAEAYRPPETDTAAESVDTEEPGGEPELQYEPFPMDALPGPVRAYVRASTRALGEEVPPAMVAVPTLSVLSGAIGDAVRLELKRSWTEPATLWTVLVAPSGSTKSPAFSHAVRPVLRRESEARDEHEKNLRSGNRRTIPTRRTSRRGTATGRATRHPRPW